MRLTEHAAETELTAELKRRLKKSMLKVKTISKQLPVLTTAAIINKKYKVQEQMAARVHQTGTVFFAVQVKYFCINLQVTEATNMYVFPYL